jgi:hypothetical protein
MKQRMAVAITAVAVAVGTVFIGVGTASAATPDAACKASGTSTITPGLQLGPAVPQTTKLNGKLTNCTGKGGVKSGTFAGTVKGSGSCTTLIKPGTVVGKGTQTIKWNTGKTSTASITVTSGGAQGTKGVFNLSGKITKGLFAGKAISGKFLGTPKFTGTGSPCSSTNPLKKITFTGNSTVA